MLRVRVLGELEVEAGGRPVEPPASRRAWALLGWLALHPGDHPRGPLAARFWPDVLDSSARASLRSAAWALRRALGPDGEDAVVATRDRLGLRCATDLQEFDALVAAGEPAAAVALCRGPLLADLDEDWALEARDVHAERFAGVLARLADEAPTPAGAVVHARRRLALDPLDEAAARDLMARLAAAGDRTGALAVFERLRDRLRDQLALAPSAATRTAAAALRDGAPRDEPPARPPPPATAPLVGRDGELAALLEARAEPGGAVAVLAGEPGIGKTRLAREVLARAAADGARTAACASLELGGAAPLSLWAELLRDLAATLPPPPAGAVWPHELTAIAPSLPMRLGCAAPARDAAPPAAPELARARLFEAAVDALEHACADRALALLFEDVHLADAASIELLAYVVRRLAGLPVLVVLTRRPAPERADVDGLLLAHRSRGRRVLELDLAPLRRGDMEQLVRAVGRLDARTRDQLVAAADGNPLLAVESARSAARGEAPDRPARTLQAVVRAAIGRLEPDARRAAELAAVAGRDLAGAELAELTTPDAVLAALDAGLFAADGGRFGFRHALLREAALADLPEARRRVRHDELAGALDGPAAEVARHLRLAGRDGPAAERLAGAAAEALRVGAVAEAEAFLAEALELRPGDPELLLDLANAHASRGRQADAQAALERALGALHPDDHRARAAAHVRAATWYRGLLCQPRRTTQEAHLALAELDRMREPDPRLLAGALATGAWGASVTGRVEQADAMLARLDDLDVDDADMVFEREIALAFRLLRDERLDEAVGQFRAVAARAGASPDRTYAAWVNAACIAGARGRLDEALDDTEQGLADAHGLPALSAPLHAVRAGLLLRLGRVDEAREALDEERRAAERSGAAELLALAEHDAGMAAATLGDHERAAELLGRALEHEAAVSRPLARLAAAEALARLGRADEADAELRAVTLEPVGPADRPGVLVARLTHVQGLVALARDDRALAGRRLEEAAAAWRRTGAAAGADEYLANLVDLGRPSVALIDPARELDRIRAELRALTPVTTER